MDVDSFFRRSSSDQGIESPFHVESPSERLYNTLISRSSSQQSNDPQSYSSDLPGSESDSGRLDHVTSLDLLRSFDSGILDSFTSNQSTPGNCAPTRASTSCHGMLSYSDFGVSTGNRTLVREDASIKSFLPVNKIMDENSRDFSVKISLSRSSQSLHSLLSSRANVAGKEPTSRRSPTTIISTDSTFLPSSSITSGTVRNKDVFEQLTVSDMNPRIDNMQGKKRKAPEDEATPAKKLKSEKHTVSDVNPMIASKRGKKRKASEDDATPAKKQKSEKTRPKRAPKPKEPKPQPVNLLLNPKDLFSDA